MNLKTLLAIALSSFTFLCYSQHKFKTNLGFKFGLNNTYINGTDINGAKSGFNGTEFYAAFFSDTKIGKNTSIENELLYSFTDGGQFIEIPIHLKNKIYKNVYILYGPKLDLIAAKEAESDKFDPIGLSLEVGGQFLITKKIFIELRYSKGLTEQLQVFQSDILKATRNTLRLGLGVKF